MSIPKMTPEDREYIRELWNRIDAERRLYELEALKAALLENPLTLSDAELDELLSEREKIPDFQLKAIYSALGTREVSRNHDAAPRPFMKCTPKMLDKILNK